MHVPRVTDVAQMRSSVPLRTRWSDEDGHGLLDHSVHLTPTEDARHAYFGALGLLEGNRSPFALPQTTAR